MASGVTTPSSRPVVDAATAVGRDCMTLCVTGWQSYRAKRCSSCQSEVTRLLAMLLATIRPKNSRKLLYRSFYIAKA